MTEDEQIEAEVDAAMALMKKIEPLLQGKGPDIQGSVCLNLVAVFVAGHHPDLRDGQIEAFMAGLRALVPIVAREKFGPTGWPLPLDGETIQ